MSTCHVSCSPEAYTRLDAVHRAYDLAEATCYTFAGSPVKFVEVISTLLNEI